MQVNAPTASTPIVLSVSGATAVTYTPAASIISGITAQEALNLKNAGVGVTITDGPTLAAVAALTSSSPAPDLQAAGSFLPAEASLLGWTHQPEDAIGNTGILVSGSLHTYRFRAASSGTSTFCRLVVGVAGSGLTAAQSFVGLYDTNGNLLAVTASSEAVLNSTGLKQIAWVAGPKLTAGQALIAAIISNGTTPPTLAGIAPAALSPMAASGAVGAAGATARLGALTGQTTAPATITLASIALSAVAPWIGVG